MPSFVNKVKKNQAIYNIQDQRISDITNFVNLDSPQTLSNKTLNTTTANSPVIKGTVTSDNNGIVFNTKLELDQPVVIKETLHIDTANGGELVVGDDVGTHTNLFMTGIETYHAYEGWTMFTGVTGNDGPIIRLEQSGTEHVLGLPFKDGIIATIGDVPTNLINGVGEFSLSQKYVSSVIKGGTAKGSSSVAFGKGTEVPYNFSVNGSTLTIIGGTVGNWNNYVLRYNNEYRRIVATYGNYVNIASAFSVTTGNITAYLLSHVAMGDSSVISGANNRAHGNYSFATGSDNVALGDFSYAGGYNTIANGPYQTVVGLYNAALTGSDALFIVGNGDSNSKQNAFVVHTDGRATIGTAPTNSMDVVNKEYADNNLENKLDKKTTTGTYVYTHDGSTQSELLYSTSNTAYTLAQRDSNKQINVALTPTANSHAASKKYVDDLLSTGFLDRQMMTAIIKDTNTNQQNKYLSNFRTNETTIGGYAAVKVLAYDSSTGTTSNTTEEQAGRYLKSMTGSEYVPTYNYDYPRYHILIDSEGKIYKPQFDSTNGLVLYKVATPWTKSVVYKYTIVMDYTQVDFGSLIVYTTKDLDTTWLYHQLRNSYLQFYYFLSNELPATYGEQIGPAFVASSNYKSRKPILLVERGTSATNPIVKPYCFFGSSIAADEYKPTYIAQVSKTTVNLDEIQ